MIDILRKWHASNRFLNKFGRQNNNFIAIYLILKILHTFFQIYISVETLLLSFKTFNLLPIVWNMPWFLKSYSLGTDKYLIDIIFSKPHENLKGR